MRQSKCALAFFYNRILIKLADSEKPDLLMLFSQRKTSQLSMFVLQTYSATLRAIKWEIENYTTKSSFAVYHAIIE